MNSRHAAWGMRHGAWGKWRVVSAIRSVLSNAMRKSCTHCKSFPKSKGGGRLQVHYTQVSGAICRRICICIRILLSLSLCSASVAAPSFIIILVSGISSGRHLHRSTNCVKAKRGRKPKLRKTYEMYIYIWKILEIAWHIYSFLSVYVFGFLFFVFVFISCIFHTWMLRAALSQTKCDKKRGGGKLWNFIKWIFVTVYLRFCICVSIVSVAKECAVNWVKNNYYWLTDLDSVFTRLRTITERKASRYTRPFV